ncbi:MAG: asparagine synthase (glutamine-hydrolyzing) [Planctomycetaceae bacterium]|jgi:asparagine synthase (glutamine-hydrolysing)|nr:asparagine synthase (glutamine-hydrolyzing) [Planctomycetaceae bacterium]
MCGITGSVWSDPSRAITQDRLNDMTFTLQHRGPDEIGMHLPAHEPGSTNSGNLGVALGFRRLAIIDVEQGQQPICNEDESIWLVFNGEIYNHAELRQQLIRQGHSFRSHCDSETIVHLYEQYGVDLFDHLNGMFAFAIWDSNNQRLMLARDRLGQKPLFYHYHPSNGQVIFGSELKSILASGLVKREMNPRALDDFLVYQYVPHPRSIFQSINKLAPGHYAVFENGKLHTQCYWNPDLDRVHDLSLSDTKTRLLELVTTSVHSRMESEVPLGAFLSGGVDSSLIVALMDQHQKMKQNASKIQTFSIGFPVKEYDESKYARQVAEYLGTDHHEFTVEPDAINILPSLSSHYDEPFADSSAIPTWYLAQLTREHVTVALSGDGGDELFAGYPRYRAIALANKIDGIPPVKALLRLGLHRLLPGSSRYKSRLRRLHRFLDPIGFSPVHRYLDWINIFPYQQRLNYYTDSFCEQLATQGDHDPALFLSAAWNQAGKRDAIAAACTADLLTYLPCDLNTKVDIATMANSLECRQPFLDHQLVEFAARIPTSMKVRRGKGKQILQDTFADLLPENIWQRPKMGFGVPLDHWFRNELRDQTNDTLLASNAQCHNWVQRKKIETMLSDHQSGKTDHSQRLWSLLMLENWFQHWIA